MDLVEQRYWDESYSEKAFTDLPDDSPIKAWIKYVAEFKTGNCIEIGTYPGGFINEFGKLGFEISGIDLTPRVSELNNIFKNKNYKIDSFWQSDFLTYKFEKKYDVVCSFGFIEHFEDYYSIIQRHVDILKDDGVLLLITPCFSNIVQCTLRKYLDCNNLKRHNLQSMNPNGWSEFLEQKGFEVLKKGYIGGFDFWVDNEKRGFIQKIVRRTLFLFLPILKTLFFRESKYYSPYCGIIARKK